MECHELSLVSAKHRPYIYFSEQGNWVDDDATFIMIFWVSFNSRDSLAASCLMSNNFRKKTVLKKYEF